MDLHKILLLYDQIHNIHLDLRLEKKLSLEILKLLVTKLRNQYNKFAFIKVTKAGALTRSYRFI